MMGGHEMKKRIVFLGIGLLALGLAGGVLSMAGEGVPLKPEQWEFKLRVLEGLREGAAEPAQVVTSSFLRYMLSADLQSKEEADQEAQVKKIFNLKDVKLLTEANLSWSAGSREKVSHSFRLDGRSYLVRLGGGAGRMGKSGDQLTLSQRFGIEVFELNGSDQTSLLDTEFAITDQKNVAVFGFEDSHGKPYFISLSQTKAVFGGVEGGVAGGVEGGVKGGVAGGVTGGVKGGVEGGVVGGVLGGTAGGVQSEELEKKKRDFEKDAVACKGDIQPPKLLKRVDPVYPEEARQKGTQGVVILEAKIDEGGRVIDTLVLRSVPGLDEAAVEALKQWVYEPMAINGKAVKALFTVTVNFRLGEKDIEKFAEGAVKVKDDINPPKLVKMVQPKYPEEARKARVEGVVILQARTDIEGKVKDVMVLRSVPALDQAAIDAVKQWVYEPLMMAGQPKEAVFTTTVRFVLDGKKPSGQEEEPEKTGDVLVPKLIKRVDPVYPEAAAKTGIQGIVLLEATTDEQGNVIKVRVLKSVPELDQAAVDALKQWKYEPMIIEGKAKGVVFTVTIRFALK
jgi:TonB family protein